MPAGPKGEKHRKATVVDAGVFCAMLTNRKQETGRQWAVALVMGRRRPFEGFTETWLLPPSSSCVRASRW